MHGFWRFALRPGRAVWLAAFWGLLSISPTGAAPRNVVLIVTDDVGLELGCYGHPLAKTPALDRLAAEGTRFETAFCTTASCSPSRSVILNGRFSHATGQYGLAHAEHHFSSFDRELSLPARLAEAGYRTVIVGKHHVTPEAVYPFQVTVTANSRDPVQMAERVRPHLAADDPKPLFLYYCPTDAHRSGEVLADLPGAPNAFGNRPQGASGLAPVVYDPAEVPVPVWLPDTVESRAELAQYLQSVSRIDQGLSRLLEIIDQTGRRDDTLVIFASDNGPPFPGGKTTVYEPGLRLPLIVRNPYQPSAGTVSQALVSWVDLAPTILDFAGIDWRACKPPLHGRSLLGTLAEARPEGWDRVYASHTFHEVTMYYPMRVVRERRYKLIANLAHELPFPSASDLWRSSTWQAPWNAGLDAPYGRRTVRGYRHRPRWELYDLEQDPDEAKNLADDPAYAAVLERLQRELQLFQERTGDPWLVKWQYE